MLLPVTCPSCGALGVAPCEACAARLRPAPPARRPPAGLDGYVALLAYEGTGRELVARLKYRNARAALPSLADALAALVDPSAIDAVAWVPTTAARRRRRGYDQSQLLAHAVARRLRRPCPRLLRRLPGPPQTGRTAADRRLGPTLVARSGRPTPANVLLVDDVCTTGATLTAAAAALRRAGAEHVWALVLAETARHS